MTTIIDTSIIYSPHWEQSTAAAQKQKEKPMDGHTYPKDSLLAPAAALKKIPTGQHLYITDGAAPAAVPPLYTALDRQERALRWCYEKLQPLVSFEEWLEQWK